MKKYQTHFLLVSCFSISAMLSCPSPSGALDVLNSLELAQSRTRVRFDLPPSDLGIPRTTRGAAGRGGCFLKDAPDLPLMPLIPVEAPLVTIDDRPTFWVYVPYTPEQVTSGVFSLQDPEGETEYWQTTFELHNIPGFVSITLPSTIDSLALSQQYSWFFDLNLDCQPLSDDTTEVDTSVYGELQRVLPSDLDSRLEEHLHLAQTPLQRVSIYASYGIWQDAVTELAQLRLQDPDSEFVREVWQDFLSQEAIDLNELSEEPIVGEVTTNSQRQ